MPASRPLRPTLLLVLGLLAPTASAGAVDWTDAPLPVSSGYRLAAGPAGRLYAVGDSVTFTSDDDGVTWTRRGSLGTTVFAHQLAVAPSGEVYAADFAFGVYRSADGGDSWIRTGATEGCNGLGVTPGGVLLAGFTYTGLGMVHRSEDAGDSWQDVALPGSSQSFPTGFFAFGDSGETYAGTIDGVYRSADQGLSWTLHNAGLLGTNVFGMTVTPNQHVFVTTAASFVAAGVHRSTDRGRTWQRVGAAGLDVRALTSTASGVLLGANGGIVVRSDDEGGTWQPIGSFQQVHSVLVTPGGHLLVGDYLVHRSTSNVLAAGPGPAAPATLALAVSGPNPVARSGRVAFELARTASVDLALFDLAGRRVAGLADGVRNAGRHTAEFDVSALPAGVYLCRLASEGRAVTRKLVVAH